MNKKDLDERLEIFVNGNIDSIMEYYGIDNLNVIKDLFTLYNNFVEDIFMESFCNNVDDLEEIANKYIDIMILSSHLKGLDKNLYFNNKSGILEVLQCYEDLGKKEYIFYYNTYIIFSGMENNFNHEHFWLEIILNTLETWG